MINTGALSYEKLVVRIFPFLTQWLRTFAKNERYHSAIIYNFLISLMINVFGKWALKRTLYFSKKIASTKNLAQGGGTTMMWCLRTELHHNAKYNYREKFFSCINLQLLRFWWLLSLMARVVFFFIIILCFAIYRSVRSHGPGRGAKNC